MTIGDSLAGVACRDVFVGVVVKIDTSAEASELGCNHAGKRKSSFDCRRYHGSGVRRDRIESDGGHRRIFCGRAESRQTSELDTINAYLATNQREAIRRLKISEKLDRRERVISFMTSKSGDVGRRALAMAAQIGHQNGVVGRFAELYTKIELI